MTDEQSEARLREWFAAAPAIDEPASLHAFLADVPATHPRTDVAPRVAGRRGLTLVAAGIAAVITATALAVVGARLLETSPRPSLAPASASGPLAASPSAGPSSIGEATRIGELEGTRSSLAVTIGGALIAVSSGPARAIEPGGPSGGPCPASSIGSIGSASVDWTAAPGAILQIAAGPADAGPLGLGLSNDCAETIVAVPDGAGGSTILPAPNPIRPDAEFFTVSPLDPLAATAWDSDSLKGKGGFVSWTADAGRTWQSQTSARPVGWDGSGAFWLLADDGELLRSRGPGFSSTRTGTVFEVPTPPQGQALDLAAVAVYRDRVLVAPRGGGLQTASTAAVATGSARSEVSLDGPVLDLSAGPRFVAALIEDGSGTVSLAISADGRSFRQAPLPPAFATSAGAAAPRLLALDDRVVLSDAGPDGVIGVWAAPIGGLPSSPAQPTPAPTPTIPSAPPSERSLTWSPVSPPPSGGETATGGGGGGVAALPTGGFIDFVVDSASRTLVYTSTDGSDWIRSGEVTGQDASGIAPFVAFDGKRYVALGRESGGEFYGDQSNGAAWISADLRRWTKAPVQASFSGAEFGAVAAGPSGFVAIGYDAGGEAVWTSADGLAWTAVTGDPALPRDSTFPSAVVFRSGQFVMVGRIEQRPAIWTSADGRRWTSLATLPARSGFGLQGLADGDAGLVTLALGDASVEVAPGDARGPVVPWVSADGTSWRAGAPSAALFGAYPAIVAVPGGYVGAGTVGLDAAARLWSSKDGFDWVEVAGVGVELAAGSSIELASDGRHVIAVGSDINGDPVMLVSNGIHP